MNKQSKVIIIILVAAFAAGVITISDIHSAPNALAIEQNTPLTCSPDSTIGGQTSCVASLQVNPTEQSIQANVDRHSGSWDATASMLFDFYGYKVDPQSIANSGMENFQNVDPAETGNFSAALSASLTDNNGRTFSSKLTGYEELNHIGDLNGTVFPSDLINNEPVILDAGGTASLLISLKYIPISDTNQSVAKKILSATVIDPTSGSTEILSATTTAHSATVWKVSPIANSYSLNPFKEASSFTEGQYADVFCNVLRDITLNLVNSPQSIELETPNRNNMSDVLPNFSSCTLDIQQRSATCTAIDDSREEAAADYQGRQSLVQHACLTNWIPTDTSTPNIWRITFASPSQPSVSMQILYFFGSRQLTFNFKY